LSANIAIVDAHLAGSKYLAGNDFTVCDIPLGITAYRWFAMDMEREDYPNFKRWYDFLCDRAPFQEHVMQPLA